jgi:glycosyltransferase involved in cell wall biosynthesis
MHSMAQPIKSKTTPKISVITVVFNGEKSIEECIFSVANQTYPNIEHIIIDGYSTDSTVDIIKKHESKIFYWLSEPDNGIGDAMNKGIDACSGDYVLVIHSDDMLIDSSSLEKAISLISDNVDVAMFSILYGKNEIKRTPHKCKYITNIKPQGLHQGMLCKRILFEQYGGFDTAYCIGMDYEIALRWHRKGVRTMISDLAIAKMGDQGISSQKDKESLVERFSEEKRIHFKHSKSIFMDLFYSLYGPSYLGYRKIKKFLID